VTVAGGAVQTRATGRLGSPSRRECRRVNRYGRQAAHFSELENVSDEDWDAARRDTTNKAAILGMTRQLAMEGSAHGIRVNSISLLACDDSSYVTRVDVVVDGGMKVW
jgi:NAD(P)-dependent dehydrogenase (short-subunit alcohol dehydrogenase family)